jgi:hypothetical protein
MIRNAFRRFEEARCRKEISVVIGIENGVNGFPGSDLLEAFDLRRRTPKASPVQEMGGGVTIPEVVRKRGKHHL